MATRLDAAARAKAETAVRSWVPHLQPQDAIRVAMPAGGWDQGAEAATKDPKEPAKEPAKPIRDVTKDPVKQPVRAPLQLSAR